MTDYEKRKEYFLQWARENKDKVSAKNKRWRDAHPGIWKDANRASYLRAKESGVLPERTKRNYELRKVRFEKCPEKKEAYLKRQEESRRARAQERLVWVRAYKMSQGCVDCGYRGHPSALHFDHIYGVKSFNISQSRNLEKAKEEIAKCVVRCANCHAIKTAKDLNW